jgi:hypothetical protein
MPARIAALLRLPKKTPQREKKAPKKKGAATKKAAKKPLAKRYPWFFSTA